MAASTISANEATQNNTRFSIEETNRTYRHSIAGALNSNSNPASHPSAPDAEPGSRHRRGSSTASDTAARRSSVAGSYGPSSAAHLRPNSNSTSHTPNRNSRASLSPGRTFGSSANSLPGSVGSHQSAYGDSTGTKGFGTGNSYENSERVEYVSVPGYYGYSTGTKGFGSGNDYEVKRVTPNPSPLGSAQVSPAGSASNVPTATQQPGSSSGSSHGDGTDKKNRKPKLGERLKATIEGVADKLTEVVAK
ncbi:hypothetical protein GYMLUDRAFT_44770 [Collybiopsis luxurians FD-317 M1]|uniref:Uncharacterized protein n=1 Tax=Collybiopsis luxurians FD-317 M1 TaxID=944289 RepID=A0A0D0CKR4_9AGAR|nr:hypothetical protein GYMLUDRAFT_44770 [Collybiopsis luxurians FD-317 M1]